ncbi:MAG: hypothetical protein JXM72_09465, partial [Deltaproteobacteria bacterium]|nr:hypothetical protein [Deltaproteobacteria bacterium]
MSTTKPCIDDLRKIYASSPQKASTLIEEYLEGTLGDLPMPERISALKALGKQLNQGAEDETPKELIDRIVPLLLGRDVCRENLSSSELLERLAGSLNTIFDIVNQLIGVINQTLGESRAGEETIRHVIGGNLECESSERPLEEHLGQIQKAFLKTHQFFKEAAEVTVGKILAEMDPGKISSEAGSSLKFGPLKKAETFDLYE